MHRHVKVIVLCNALGSLEAQVPRHGASALVTDPSEAVGGKMGDGNGT